MFQLGNDQNAEDECHERRTEHDRAARKG